MWWIYVLAVFCVEHLKYAVAPKSLVSFRITQLNHRKVGQSTTVNVPNVSLEKCVEACILRPKCIGVNYLQVSKFCEVLTNEEDGFQLIQKKSFVTIDREDMDWTSTISQTCSSCTEGVCNITTGLCPIKECGPVRIVNGIVKGNMRLVGSKVKVSCQQSHTLSDGVGTMVCQPNGTWSSTPSCLWDCRDPRPGYRSIVSSGATTNGTVRTYTCKEDFFISGNKTETTHNVTCHYGSSWDPKPRCVQDCSEPNNASEHFASSREGSAVADFSSHTYTCPHDHVVFLIGTKNISGTIYTGRFSTNAQNHTIRCNGVHPLWAWTNFFCVKSCIQFPSMVNVRRVVYTLSEDNVTAEVKCVDGYRASDGPVTLGKGSVNLHNDSGDSSVALSNCSVILGKDFVTFVNGSVRAGNDSVDLGSDSVDLGSDSVNLVNCSVSSLGNDFVIFDNCSVSSDNALFTLGNGSVSLDNGLVNLDNAFVSLCNGSDSLGNFFASLGHRMFITECNVAGEMWSNNTMSCKDECIDP